MRCWPSQACLTIGSVLRASIRSVGAVEPIRVFLLADTLLVGGAKSFLWLDGSGVGLVCLMSVPGTALQAIILLAFVDLS